MITVVIFTRCDDYESIVKDYNYNYMGDNIVVQGFISDKDGVNIWVNKTFSPLDTVQSTLTLPFTNVYLYAKGELFLQLERIDDNYFSTLENIQFETNMEYSIEVIIDGYPKISSNYQIIPITPKIDSARLDISDQINEYIELWFSDPELYDNYYTYTYSCFYSGIEIVPLNQEIGVSTLLSDISFSGNQKYIQIEDNFSSVDGYPDSIQIKLYSLSVDYYNYLKTIEQNRLNIYDIFYRPIPITSNMSDGFGIFGAYSLTKKTIIFD